MTLVSTDPVLRANKFYLTSPFSTSTHTNIAAALTEVNSATQRMFVDLTNRTQAKLSGFVLVTSNAGCKMHVQYALIADQTTWADLIVKASGLALDTVSATVCQVTSWVTIPAAAAAPVIVKLMSVDGDGAADPQTRAIEFHYR